MYVFKENLRMYNARDLLVMQYSSRGESFLFPTFLGRPLIVLPCSEMQWLVDQPESILSVHAQLQDAMSFDQTILDKAILKSPIHEAVIRGELTRTLGMTVEPVREELLQSLDSFWGTSTEWHDIELWDTLVQIVARVSNRVFVGSSLCKHFCGRRQCSCS